MTIGIIDIGTNSALLLIAQVHSDHSITTLHDECRLVRLGEGLNTQHEFQPSAMERTLLALRDFAATCKKHDCDSIHAVGTAGFRMAKNANDFVDRVSNELGIKIKIIDGQEEARLIYRSCQHDFGHLGHIAVLDIGGGSTEIVTQKDKNVAATSFPFGVVTLTERFLHSDPPTRKEIEALTRFVGVELTVNSAQKKNCLHPLELRHLGTQALRHFSLIATAGTPTTLAAIHLGLTKYDSKAVHGHRLTVNDISILKDRLSVLPFSERAKIPCLPEKRADVIIAGINILVTVMEQLGVSEITVSDRGLRFGVLYE